MVEKALEELAERQMTNSEWRMTNEVRMPKLEGRTTSRQAFVLPQSGFVIGAKRLWHSESDEVVRFHGGEEWRVGVME